MVFMKRGNMLNKKIIFILLILGLLVLAGCKARPQLKEEQTYRGTVGLDMKFAPGRPQSKIFDTDSVDVVVELNNKGTYPAKGMIHISGFDPGIIQFPFTSQAFGPLDARSRFNPVGGFDTVEFRSNNIILPIGSDSYKPRIVADSCYVYRTQGTFDVCIDPKPYELTARKSCVPRIVSSAGQGAPLTVTSIKPESGVGKTLFQIDISNTGGGTVVSSLEAAEFGNNCPFNLNFNDYDIVNYEVRLSGASTTSCTPRSPLRLNLGRGTIFCNFDIPVENTNAYTTILEVNLDYGYWQNIQRSVEIVQVPR